MSDTPTGRPLPVPSGRLTRAGRLGAMATGIAGGMALSGLRRFSQGERPEMRDLLMTPANMRRVAEELAQMRGAAMKIGQLLSMDTGDILPPELSQIFARLRQDAHFMPPRQLKQVLTRAWGADWLRAFQRFDVRPLAAASIGQVHRAVLKDGRELAIKVQYPGVARSIDSDVSNVGALIRLSGLIPKGFELGPYLDEARRQLREETDYALEGRHLTEFTYVLGATDTFDLPVLAEDWTRPEVLSMSFVAGDPIEAVVDLPQQERDRIAGALVDLLFREMFEFGLMQSDPNFANYRYNRETGRVALLDFGATRRLNPDLLVEYRRLFASGLAGDADGFEGAAEAIGFIQPETEPSHRTRVLSMIGMVFDAIREAEQFDFADPALSRRMNTEGMALAEEGFVPPPLPMDALYIQRKFGGMFLLASRLGARLPVAGMLARRLD